MVEPGTAWPSYIAYGVGEEDPSIPELEEFAPRFRLAKLLRYWAFCGSKGSIPNMSSSIEGEAVELRWLEEGTLWTLG
jgi:hypothetical protein